MCSKLRLLLIKNSLIKSNKSINLTPSGAGYPSVMFRGISVKVLMFLLLVIGVSGCVIYPHRNIEKPGLLVSIVDNHADIVYASVGYTESNRPCPERRNLLNSEGEFRLDPEYSDWKSKILLSMDCVQTLGVCTVDAKGTVREWRTNIGFICNENIGIYRMDCEIYEDMLNCINITKVST